MKFLESILIFSKTKEKILVFTVNSIDGNGIIYLDKFELKNNCFKIVEKARKISSL